MQNAVTTYGGVDYSAVYNYAYYCSNNADLRNAFGPYDDDALLRHFVSFGMNEGRRASAAFDPSSYRLEYRDLRVAFGDDWRDYYLHYIECGRGEGRDGAGCATMQNAVTTYGGVDYSAVYNYAYYYSNHADLQSAFGPYDDDALLRHFVSFGMNEGRRACSTFIVQVYRSNYPDLLAAFGNNLRAYYLHYITYGQYEGRKAC